MHPSAMREAVELDIRPAKETDVELLWQWANDPEVRRNSFSRAEISFEGHAEWFRQRIHSGETRIYVAERDGTPVGQVRYDRTNEEDSEIDISIAAEHRGRGFGVRALVLTKRLAVGDLGVRRVVGIVVGSNLASCRAFLRADFTEGEPRLVRGRECRVFCWLSR